MALIKCPECGKEISDKSKACIHCGYPLELGTNSVFNGDIQLNAERQTISVCGKEIALTDAEFAVMELFITNPGDIFSGNELANVVQSSGAVAVENNPAYYVKHIIDKIEPDPKHPKYIIIDWGRGYHFAGNTQKSIIKNPLDQELRCPRCKSTQIVTGARGFSFVTGFLGSSQTVNRCGKCGYKWKPKI